MTILLLAGLVVAASCAIHGAVGFGMNLLAVPVLAVLDPVFVPGPAVAAGLVLSVLMVVREPAAIQPRIGWAVLGLAPGTLAALLVLTVVSSADLAVPIGVLVILAVLMSAVRLDLRPTRLALVVAGTASGFLATAAAIGGPPLALLYARASGAQLRSNLSAFFVVTAATSLGALLLAGRFGADEWRATAVFLPSVVLGFLASGPLRHVVDRGQTRPAVLTLSALAGVAGGSGIALVGSVVLAHSRGGATEHHYVFAAFGSIFSHGLLAEVQ